LHFSSSSSDSAVVHQEQRAGRCAALLVREGGSSELRGCVAQSRCAPLVAELELTVRATTVRELNRAQERANERTSEIRTNTKGHYGKQQRQQVTVSGRRFACACRCSDRNSSCRAAECQLASAVRRQQVRQIKLLLLLLLSRHLTGRSEGRTQLVCYS
jgi:hypothetical protein